MLCKDEVNVNANQPNPSGKSKIISIVVGLLIVVGAIFAGRYLIKSSSAKAANGKPQAAARPVPIVASPVNRGDFDVYLNGLGSVTAFNTVTVRSRVDGQLMKIGFKEGDPVREGDMIAEIDPTPYIVQREQTEGQKARDLALLNNARRDLKRYTDAGTEAVSQQQIDTAQSQVENYEGTLKVDDAAIHAAQVQIDYCHITSPITGRAGLRLVDVGNQIHASDSTGIVVITQLQPIAISFTLPEDVLPQVFEATHDNPHVPLDAYSRDSRTKLASGKLLAIDNQIDSTTGTFRIKAEFENKESTLYPNQFVNVRLLVRTLRGVVLAETAAIQHGPQGAFVYVAKKDPAAPEPAVKADENSNTKAGGERTAEIYVVELRAVETGQDDGSRTVITSGLAPGELVATAGVDKLIDGSKVILRRQGGGESGSKKTPEKSGASTQQGRTTGAGK